MRVVRVFVYCALLLFCFLSPAFAGPLGDAQRFFLIGDWKKAAEAYDTVLLDELSAGDLIKFAEAYYQAGNLEKCKGILKMLLQQEDNIDVKVLSLLVAAKEGDIASSVKRLEAMLDSSAGDVRVLTAIVTVHRSVDANRAYFYALTAVEKDPNSFLAWFLLGSIHEAEERFEDAVKSYRQSVRLNPLSALAHNNLGYSYKELRFYSYAIEEYAKAIELMPDRAGFYYNIGNAYNHEEAVDEAFRSYKKAVELDPSFAKAHYNLARTYLRMDMVEEAINEFRFYLRYGTKAVFAFVASRDAVEDEIELLERYLQGNQSVRSQRGLMAR